MGVNPYGKIASVAGHPHGVLTWKHVPTLISTSSPKSLRSSVGCAPEVGLGARSTHNTRCRNKGRTKELLLGKAKASPSQGSFPHQQGVGPVQGVLHAMCGYWGGVLAAAG